MAIVLSLWLSVAWSQGANKPSNIKVDILVIKPTNIAKRVEVVGTLQPITRVHVRVQIPGVVEKLHYGIGQSFEKRDLLAEISTKELKLQIGRAESNVVYLQKEHAVEKQIVEKNLDIQIAQNSLSLAERTYELSQKTLDRQKQLFEKALLSQSQMERAENQHTQKRIQFEQAKIAFEKQSLHRTSKLDGLKNQLDLAVNALKSAQDQYKKSRIFTPFKGMVLQQTVEEGEFLSAGTQLYEIADLSRVLVKLSVGEKSVQYLKIGQAVNLSVDAIKGKSFKSKIWKVGTEARSQGRSFDVELILNNSNQKFRPGMTARAKMPSLSQANQILLPLYSVLENDKGRYIFVVKGDTAKQRFIKTGEVVGEQVQVISGVEVGAKVVVRGHTFLGDNEPIQVIRTL